MSTPPSSSVDALGTLPGFTEGSAWYDLCVITTMRVSNFRSLAENVKVDFGRFTALVGPNGSGKSSVVDALRFVADCMHMGLNGAITSRSGINGVRRWSGG